MFMFTGRVHATAVCGRSRPCTRPAHSPFTAVYTAVYDGRYTVVRHVHTSTQQLKGCVHAMYTSVYTACTQSCTWQVGLNGRVHGSRRHVAAVGRVHGRNAPCTRSCTRPIHSRVHVPLHGPCTRHVHGRLHGPTRPVRGRVHGQYTAVYTGHVHRPYTAL